MQHPIVWTKHFIFVYHTVLIPIGRRPALNKIPATGLIHPKQTIRIEKKRVVYRRPPKSRPPPSAGSQIVEPKPSRPPSSPRRRDPHGWVQGDPAVRPRQGGGEVRRVVPSAGVRDGAQGSLDQGRTHRIPACVFDPFIEMQEERVARHRKPAAGASIVRKILSPGRSILPRWAIGLLGAAPGVGVDAHAEITGIARGTDGVGGAVKGVGQVVVRRTFSGFWFTRGRAVGARLVVGARAARASGAAPRAHS